jgi:hypothetical protein
VFNGRHDHRPAVLSPITIEAAGTHRFDIPHLRREGAERLLRLLLKTAGLPLHLHWRVRIDKKITCGPQTRPISVYGYEAWRCSLKIKPGDNNTAHLCSLIMPAGYVGGSVFHDLKAAEKTVNKTWLGDEETEVPEILMSTEDATEEHKPIERQAAASEIEAVAVAVLEEDPPRPSEPEVVPDEPMDEELNGSVLRGWSHDPDKVRLTLLAIEEGQQRDGKKDIDTFVETLTEKMGWHGLRRKQIGGIFTALVRRGLIIRQVQGSRVLGYGLTLEGEKLIRDLKAMAATAPALAVAPSPVTAPIPALSLPVPPLIAVSPADTARLFTQVSDLLLHFAANAEKLQENRSRRAQLLAEIERLDAEASDLARVVNDPEIQAFATRVLGSTKGPG